jgi:hypothetical protein
MSNQIIAPHMTRSPNIRIIPAPPATMQNAAITENISNAINKIVNVIIVYSSFNIIP